MSQKIVQLASDQFQVPNATEHISAVPDISNVFSPPHHGPRNVPVEVTNSGDGEKFTHFPIVNSGFYYVFLPDPADTVEVVRMNYHGPSQHSPHFYPIALEPVAEDLSGTPFKQGFKSKDVVIFNQSDPQPIAIHFNIKTVEPHFSLKYIVVGAYPMAK
ncbi:MAG: hypothetical protein AAF551_03015 [Bacteroidota bacterium]